MRIISNQTFNKLRRDKHTNQNQTKEREREKAREAPYRREKKISRNSDSERAAKKSLDDRQRTSTNGNKTQSSRGRKQEAFPAKERKNNLQKHAKRGNGSEERNAYLKNGSRETSPKIAEQDPFRIL